MIQNCVKFHVVYTEMDTIQSQPVRNTPPSGEHKHITGEKKKGNVVYAFINKVLSREYRGNNK